ncbi:hypothetical protein GQ457_11G002780 [Hibiscus cannabinus]
MEEDDPFQSVHFGKAPDTRYQAEIPEKRNLSRLSIVSRRKVRITLSYHAPYVLGDTHATVNRTKNCMP